MYKVCLTPAKYSRFLEHFIQRWQMCRLLTFLYFTNYKLLKTLLEVAKHLFIIDLVFKQQQVKSFTLRFSVKKTSPSLSNINILQCCRFVKSQRILTALSQAFGQRLTHQKINISVAKEIIIQSHYQKLFLLLSSSECHCFLVQNYRKVCVPSSLWYSQIS